MNYRWIMVVLLLLGSACSPQTKGGSVPETTAERVVEQAPAEAPRIPPVEYRQPTRQMPAPPAAGSGAIPRTTTPARPRVSPVDSILATLREGHVVFDAPTTMEQDEPKIIELILRPAPLQTPELSPNQQTASARIANTMEATLTGLGFSIVATTPTTQAVSGLQPTVWRWQVTPIQNGVLVLDLSLNALIEVDGHRTSYVIRTLSEEITVTVAAKTRIEDFIHNNWKWLWTTILIPVVGYLIQRYRKKII